MWVLRRRVVRAPRDLDHGPVNNAEVVGAMRRCMVRAPRDLDHVPVKAVPCHRKEPAGCHACLPTCWGVA